ncbi:MAG: radical SAM protein [Candidatus Pacearchaeota archaeon]
MIEKLHYYSIPHLIHIETTYGCNQGCIFCYNPNRNYSIDYKKLDKIIDSVYKSKIPHVYLIGGEPSLLSVKKLNEYIDKLSKYSSVTIVTNGFKYMKGLSKNLACLGIPIHGDKKTHEYLTNNPKSYNKIISNIKKYIEEGFDVRIIPVLTSINYNQMYNIIKLSTKLGAESVFVDRFEPGGIGSKLTKKLLPSTKQFKIALDQMIKAKKDFGIPLGFGTAIPYCLDKRLIDENIYANCGAGITFGAINPNGDFRICNQSLKVYGNVLKEPLEKIWNKKELDEFRNLSWVNEPCKSCNLLYECLGGCKVDSNFPGEFCIDYSVRCCKEPLNKIKIKTKKLIFKVPTNMRRFKKNRYLKLNDFHKEIYIVTRYQTVEIDESTKRIVKFILKNEDYILEKEILDKFSNDFEKKDLRELLSKFIYIGAIDEI